ncbi:MAG TPA: DUF3795 domain-containing protein [Clostridia bacterium]|nr:DUF3795 domain-containing protein [Clostridia bacterium]
MDEKLIAPCGMTCCDCLFRQERIYETAKSFKAAINELEYDKFLLHFSRTNIPFFNEFKRFPQFLELLDKIIALQCENVCMEARGCSVPSADKVFGGIVKATHKCDVLLCIESKGYEGCWNCDELEECEKKKLFRSTYGNVPVENCKIIRDKGKAAVEPRENKYYIWQQENK